MRFSGWSNYWAIVCQIAQYARYTLQSFWRLPRQVWWDIRRTKQWEDEMIAQWPSLRARAYLEVAEDERLPEEICGRLGTLNELEVLETRGNIRAENCEAPRLHEDEV